MRARKTKTKETLDLTHPHLLEEWDYQANGAKGIYPEGITSLYKGDVAWICKKEGHPWEASVVARARKNHPTGCPVCAGQKVIAGVNDFAHLCPELLKDWDWEENSKIGIDPTQITAYSGTVVNWICQHCNHKWKTTLNNRSSHKRGCPNCSLKSTSFAEQAVYFYVKKLFPNAINRYKALGFELDIYIPELNLGIEYDGVFFHNDEASLIRDTKKFQKCQEKGIKLIRLYDSNAGERRTADVSIGIEDIKDFDNLNKVIRLLLADLDPESNKWTRRNPMQIWSTIDHLVDVKKDYYDIIEKKRIREVENSFGKEFPNLLADWNYEANGEVNPLSLTAGTDFLANWKCSICSYKWISPIKDRARGTGCPCCNRRVLVKGVNDLETLHPEALEEWDYEKNTILPCEVINYKEKYWWKCKDKECNHSWQATIHDRFIREDKTGCPKCANQLRAKKRHERQIKKAKLFERYPKMLQYWDRDKNVGVDPMDVTPNCGIKYGWKCPRCGFTWEVSPNCRSIKYGCKKCKDRIDI